MLKNLPANARDVRDVGSIPASGRSSGEGNGNPLQHSYLENPQTEEPGRCSPWGCKESGFTSSKMTFKFESPEKSLLMCKKPQRMLFS